MALNPQQRRTARFLQTLAMSRGATPLHAREFASAALAESSLNPNAHNASGATGLFQLLSSGYQQKAQKLGGLRNPRANALAILPDYMRYWHSHPGARPGEAGAAVERSGEGAGFYARGLGQIPKVGGGVATRGVQQPLAASVRPGPPGLATVPTPQSDVARRALVEGMIRQAGEPNIQALQPLMQGFQAEQKANAAPPRVIRGPAPQKRGGSGVEVQATPGGKPMRLSPTSDKIIALAKQYQGLPYRWGGTSPKTGFDCSGFVQWLYAHGGVKLPRTSQQQFHAGQPVHGPLKEGDLVFFEHTASGPGHVGLYIGHGQFIESPKTGASIRISNLAGRTDYVGARRVGGK